MAEKRLIFTLSPGRCGTKYLAYAMGLVPGVAAFHEPSPDFVSVAAEARHDPRVAVRFWLEEKLPWIESLGPLVYFESSHLFGKGFVRALVATGRVPDVVVLSRPHREVALSFWRRRSVPGRTGRGRDYLLDPTGLGNWDRLTDYQLCYWYCLEMGRRIESSAALIDSRGGMVEPIEMRRLVTRDGFAALCRRLALPGPTGFLGPTVVNSSPQRWKTLYPEGDMDDLEAEVECP